MNTLDKIAYRLLNSWQFLLFITFFVSAIIAGFILFPDGNMSGYGSH